MLPQLLLLLGTLAAQSLADCCLPLYGLGMCEDGTLSTPNCGLGKCNIFGCDCDGGELTEDLSLRCWWANIYATGCRVDDGSFCSIVLAQASACLAAGDSTSSTCQPYVDTAYQRCLQVATADEAKALRSVEESPGLFSGNDNN